MTDSILIVGRGALGRLVARVLRGRGLRVSSTHGRSPAVRSVGRATTILLAVPDPSIAIVSATIAPSLTRGTVVLHAAGSLTVDVLASAREAGAHVGVMHPLVSFARGARPSGFAGALTVIAGDRLAVARAKSIAIALETKPIVADVHGPAYHAAASIAANGAVALVNEASRLLVALGFSERDAALGLAGILATVVSNVREVGVPGALTGPIARGDASTVSRHRDALASDARALDVYDAIGTSILACAIERGLEEKSARAVRRALESPTPPRPPRESDRPRRSGSRRPRPRR